MLINIVEEPILGQSLLKHSAISVSGPLHRSPPLEGAGLLHPRIRVLLPVPQEAEQSLHIAQPLHAPLTKTPKKDCGKVWLIQMKSVQDSSGEVRENVVKEASKSETIQMLLSFSISERYPGSMNRSFRSKPNNILHTCTRF